MLSLITLIALAAPSASAHAGHQARTSASCATCARSGSARRSSGSRGPPAPFVSTLLFGLLSFLALREFVTLTHTRRGDHRSLLLAFFVVLPLQYVLVATRRFNAFTVFIPVYVFLAIPVVSALATIRSASSSAPRRSSGASWSASTA